MSDTGDLDAGLGRLLSDARAEEAARARIRERGLRAAATTDATLAGIVLDLAEGGDPVTVRTAFGRTLAGRVSLVVQDAIAIDTGPATTSYVPLAAIASIRRQPGAPSAEHSGDRRPARTASLAAILADLAAQRPRVAAAVTGEPALVTGELRAAGSDVLTIRLDGDRAVTVHVSVAQLSELTVLASG